MGFRQIVDKWRQRAGHILDATKRIMLPGLGDLSVFDVGSLFVKALSDGTMGVRSSAIAFNFFLAMFPALLFILALIPYIPILNFQTELIGLIEELVPENIFDAIEGTILNIAMTPRGGLLSIGFITTIVLVSNGVTAVIKAFNASINVHENRTFIGLRVSSLIMMALITLLISIAIALLIFGRTILGILISKHILYGTFSKVVFYIVQWLIILTLCFASVSVIYYFAPAKHTKMGFVSIGSMASTTLLLLTSAAFGFYLSNFSQYNELYGAIGTIIAILVWLNLNAYILLLGFELNLSIAEAHKNKVELSGVAKGQEVDLNM